MRKPFVMVKMEGSKTTSKTGMLKALLLKAWRERWSDIQWGINIKTILPRGVSGDVYNLADCILQQATVGSGANQLVISYLKHSLAAQIVSYAAVLQRIAKFDAFHKPHCILSLLELLESFLDHVTCQGKEEGLLATAVSSIILWLLQVFHYNLSVYPAVGTNPIQCQELLEKSTALLNYIVHTDFLLAMFCLAKQHDHEEYSEITKKCQEINSLMMMNTQFKPPAAIHETLQVICNMEVDKIAPLNNKIESITYCMQALIAIEVLANPSADTQIFVNEMLMVQRIKGYSLARLYSELIRAALISLNNASSSATKHSIWGAFTFLKVPQIIHHMHSTIGNKSNENYSVEVVEAFEMLLQKSPLLDILDLKCSCNCVKSLLESMLSLSLVTEAHLTYFSQKRDAADLKLQKLEPTGLQGSIPTFILRAEATFTGILKTMGTDFMKIQDAIYGMLCQVLSGKNLEAILAVAIVEGKLKHFVSKLIKFNECSLTATADMGKSSQSKAMLFDISFLILCAIVQEYGAEAVLEENGDSFFEQWVRDCMVQKGVPKSPDHILEKCDPQKVDLLVHQLINPDVDFKNSTMKCLDLCLNVTGAMKEVLFAWEQGSLSATDVKRILDALKQKMGSLAVCASAWLCSYMYIVHQDALLKPMNMVQQFQTPLSDIELAQMENLKERSALMVQIIRKMQYDVHPPTSKKVLALGHSIVSKQPISEQLDSVWKEIKSKGQLHIDSTHVVESILNTAGPVWFVKNLVKEVIKFRYREELDKAVDLVFAMFHLNIEKCTEALLLQVLPQYLYNAKLCEELVEPQSSTLAKLAVYCIYSSLEYSNSGKTGVSKKRGRHEDAEDIEALCPTNKLRRLNDNTAESSTLFLNTLPPSKNAAKIYLKEPLQSALENLYKAFSQLAGKNGEVTPQTHFIFQFLVYMVQCGQDRTQIVLQKLPTELVPTLIKAMPEMFNISLLLRLHDLSTSYGRKDTARDLCMLRNMQLRPD